MAKKITDLQQRTNVTDDLNFPSDDTIQSYRVTGAQIHDYIRTRFKDSHLELSNLTIVPSVGSSALTIAVKTKAGTDATATDPIRVGFRSATLTSGSFALRQITAALSMVVSSGSTLGQTSGQPSRIWIYLIDNGGVLELAVSHAKYREDQLVTTTAEGGAGAADSSTAIYSTTARAGVPIRLIGYIDNTQTTAGTWASAGSQLQLAPYLNFKPPTLTKLTSGSGNYYVPAGCTRIIVSMVGGGGGGSGGGSSSAGGGASGGNSTFGGSLLVAGGGGGAGGIAGIGSGGGAGGDVSFTAGPFVKSFVGQPGQAGHYVQTNAGNYMGGPMGGSSMFGGGGAGFGPGSSAAGSAGATNSGGGGAGAAAGGAVSSGNGGGGAGGIEATIVNPESSYAYAVGAGGGGGAGGVGGVGGGAGGSGIIIIEEFYD